MKSGFEIRPFTQEDVPVLQIAAARGLDITPMTGGTRYIGWCHNKYGYAPGAIVDINETPYVIEPHITWMPWMSPRLKIASFKWAMDQWKKTVFLMVLKEHNGFYEQIAKRGLIRKVGVLHVHKDAGEEIHMYQKAEALS